MASRAATSSSFETRRVGLLAADMIESHQTEVEIGLQMNCFGRLAVLRSGSQPRPNETASASI
ncbi:hypothetical protein B1812_04405 [Methylocystis bryophila]|uniref:Uncharacterized protein n=1 Tax=Methylocystis bryophila TaxID=655015 RepID=A0A1W6MSH3_9HYPH|nr:hypothetical protein B1812_04405 [Methylocystis bryophila]